MLFVCCYPECRSQLRPRGLWRGDWRWRAQLCVGTLCVCDRESDHVVLYGRELDYCVDDQLYRVKFDRCARLFGDFQLSVCFSNSTNFFQRVRFEQCFL